jgi:hypothetical protein
MCLLIVAEERRVPRFDSIRVSEPQILGWGTEAVNPRWKLCRENGEVVFLRKITPSGIVTQFTCIRCIETFRLAPIELDSFVFEPSMCKFSTILRKHPSLHRYFHSSPVLRNPYKPVAVIKHAFNSVDVKEFRRRAFVQEIPMLMTEEGSTGSFSIPAAAKWFVSAGAHTGSGASRSLVLSSYLDRFRETILPYELIVGAGRDNVESGPTTSRKQLFGASDGIDEMLAAIIGDSPAGAFHRFEAPLSLFLEASREPRPYQLYIAQAQLLDLPKELQDDLPTPRLVREAGKGDIYDSNLWLGMPPTYTPLHKDPNPNLFLQLASTKHVRLFRPEDGAPIIRAVQIALGMPESGNFRNYRGEEMMQEPERAALKETVWNDSIVGGFEAVLNPGDALFIPNGWWHSIKSVGTDITASVNWWFR